jgi:MOSC domain-containing protein
VTSARIAALHVYPVKGCRGIAPSSVTVATTGLAIDGIGDREWMVTDRAGRFVTQRELPRLALIETAVASGMLTLSVPQTAPLVVPMDADGEALRDVVVWRSEVRGIDMGHHAADWLSACLAADVRLVRFDRSDKRACNREFAGDSGAHTFFSDGYPVLVIGEASLAELNERLAARGQPALPMNRFRPNVVLHGLPPHAEDHLETIAAGDVVLRCVKPCVRCQVTTTDQDSAQVGLEPLRTLGEYRMNERLGGVTFGMNAIVTAGAGNSLAIGASATVDYRF